MIQSRYHRNYLWVVGAASHGDQTLLVTGGESNGRGAIAVPAKRATIFFFYKFELTVLLFSI